MASVIDAQETPNRSKISKIEAVKKPEDVSEETWRDFQQQRKTKGAKITETALSGIRKEATLAGWGMDEALAECCLRGWTGFKSDWVARRGSAPTLPASRSGRREL